MDDVQFSPLVLMHPDGFVRHSLVIGENAPIRLIPPHTTCSATQPIDLILWAPSVEECQQPGWMRSLSERIRAIIAPDGLVYAMIPTPYRAQAQHALRGQGLEIELAYAHLPDWSESHNWVPLEAVAAKYSFTRQFPTKALVRFFALAILRLPLGQSLVGLRYPSAAFVARPHGSRVLFLWLYRLADIQTEIGRASLIVNWKVERYSVVIHGFGRGPEPKIVAKTIVTRNEQYEQGNEYRILEQLGPAARQAGAQVPQPLGMESLDDCPIFLESFLHGTCAAAVLNGHPQRVESTIIRITNWLLKWNQATVVKRKPNITFLTQTILEPLNVIAPQITDSEGYRTWLVGYCSEFINPVKLVDAHNDLTLWNILLQSNGSIGVVDWREARPAELPLGDFFYLFIDAVSVAHRWGHDHAFLQCLEPYGRYHNLFRTMLNRMQAALDLPTPLVNLSLHACFLHHAANEQYERLSAESHPFLQILYWLEKNRHVLDMEER